VRRNDIGSLLGSSHSRDAQDLDLAGSKFFLRTLEHFGQALPRQLGLPFSQVREASLLVLLYRNVNVVKLLVSARSLQSEREMQSQYTVIRRIAPYESRRIDHVESE